MTTEVKEKIWQKLGEAGLVFLLMGSMIWFFYDNLEKTKEENRILHEHKDKVNEQRFKDIREEVKILREELKECTDYNFELMHEQKIKLEKVIEENTRALNRLR